MNPSFSAYKTRFVPAYGARLSLHKQQGVLIIVTMILLLIISGVAAYAIKGTGSTDAVANNTRTQALAMQAAEAALRYAEVGVLNQSAAAPGVALDAAKQVFTIADAPISVSTPGDWTVETKWDKSTSTSTVVNLYALDGKAACPTDYTSNASRKGDFCSLYKRPPECMAQYASSDKKVVWVTCRGFGPDVVASVAKDLPNGAEVFLQSVLRLP
ncbi:MAG TPA: hypothetical protein PKC80_08375 [Burkholderiaceae bacterium]|nr:hypothetical protein [Burkholderiaceae bacterium]